LISVFDINFIDTGSCAAQPGALPFTQNLIAYLGAPTVIAGGPSSVPLPPTVILVLTGILGILMFAVWRRMKGRATV
jgi:hypothetical protein